MVGRLSSAKGLLSLLMETDPSVLHFALSRLNAVVDEFWYELSTQLGLLDELSNSTQVPEPTRQSAALLAARTHFHLGAFDDSVHYAIKAGALFKDCCAKRSDFTDTILGRCIDLYVAAREAAELAAEGGTLTDQVLTVRQDSIPAELEDALESMFESLAESWLQAESASADIKELVGFCIRARRDDLLHRLLKAHVAKTASGELIGFTLKVANRYVKSIAFRTKVLRTLADLYTTGLADVDFFSLVDCLLFLGDSTTVATLLKELLAKDKLLAYQIGFDLFESANQEFLAAVVKELDGESVQLAPALASDAAAPAPVAAPSPSGVADPHIKQIILGQITTELYVKYLYSQCKADVHVLAQTKRVLPPINRQAVLHTATVMASAFMYCGTTIDGFLRDNLQWVASATDWARFSATASIGVVHHGHVDKAMELLQPYLPNRSNVGQFPFQEAGALYGLGLIHAGLGTATSQSREAVTYLRNAHRDYNSNEQMVHGASLGLGLVAMGLQDETITDALYVSVNGADAVPGESAALAIGMVNLSTGNANTIELLLKSAREHNQKEKTIRGLCAGIALTLLGKEDHALPFIKDMVTDRDPWIRVGGCHTIGLAYAGTSNSKAIESLLQVCVKDVSDEVRRVAISMIGFICLADTERCVSLTRIFADSYNPHVRYGVSMALGIAAAGSGHQHAVDLLWLLKDDTTDFVRQGAIIALSMVLIQQPNALNERAKEFRSFLSTKVADAKGDTCTKFGCILASGIIDACGRNASINLHRNGHPSKKAVVGVFLFLQHWHWFPFAHMLSLAFQPTCILCLNERLEMPEYKMLSTAPASQFAPPPSVQQVKKETSAAAKKSAVLSTTQKHADQKLKKKAAEGGSAPSSPTTGAAPTSMPTDAEKKEEPEAKTEELFNPARVSQPQLSAVQHGYDQRWTAVKRAAALGVCMLRDQSPDQPVKLVSVDLSKRDEVPMPEPFEWP